MPQFVRASRVLTRRRQAACKVSDTHNRPTTPPAGPVDRLDSPRHPPYLPPLAAAAGTQVMRIRNSLKSAKVRDKNCRVVRRHGRVYVINKKNPRMKCRQG